MNYNFHTHTMRCRHANDSDEEYIIKAIEAGITHLGFSDHAPLMFPDGHESHYRIPMNEAKNYIEDLRALREKYKDKIEIIIGLEMEYYSEHFESMLETARNIGAEYIILGQHFILGEHPNGIGASGPTDNAEHLITYVNEVTEAMKTGMFSYLAHPDLMCFTGDDGIYDSEMRRLCKAAKELKVPLEVNLLGIRKKKHYPNDFFWKIAGEVGGPVVIGVDAHASGAFLNKEQYSYAKELIKRYNLNYIGMPKLINI